MSRSEPIFISSVLKTKKRDYTIEVYQRKNDRVLNIQQMKFKGAEYQTNSIQIEEEHLPAFMNLFRDVVGEMIGQSPNQQKQYNGFEEIRKTFPQAYQKWTTEEESELITLFNDGVKTATIAKHLQRKPGAIRSRLKKLELLNDDNETEHMTRAEEALFLTQKYKEELRNSQSDDN